MNAALDTLQVTKDLKAASFSEAQAEALAKLLRDRQEAGFSLVATKADVSALGSDLRRELADWHGLQKGKGNARLVLPKRSSSLGLRSLGLSVACQTGCDALVDRLPAACWCGSCRDDEIR